MSAWDFALIVLATSAGWLVSWNLDRWWQRRRGPEIIRSPGFDTVEDALNWADKMGGRDIRLSDGPDGKIRGSAVVGRRPR